MISDEDKKFVLLVALLLLVAAFIFLDQICFEATIDAKLWRIEHPRNTDVMASSDIYEYIRASNQEYRYIVKHGERSLDYMLRKFSKNDDNSFEQFVMAVACLEIIGTKTSRDTPRDWISGRDWYNKYMKSRPDGSPGGRNEILR